MCTKYIGVVFVAAFVCSAVALPSQDNNEKDLINLINKVDNEQSLPLFGGLRVDRVPAAGRSFGGAANGVESFEERAERYLQTHELNLSLTDADDEEAESEFAGRAIQEEPRRNRMKKMLLPLLLALKLKKAVVIKVLFMIIKFISLKSLAISFLALLLAGAQFFKDLLGKKKDHITTAYIAGNPLNAEVVHSDWSRNGQAAASDLAYNHYGLAQPF